MKGRENDGTDWRNTFIGAVVIAALAGVCWLAMYGAYRLVAG